MKIRIIAYLEKSTAGFSKDSEKTDIYLQISFCDYLAIIQAQDFWYYISN